MFWFSVICKTAENFFSLYERRPRSATSSDNALPYYPFLFLRETNPLNIPLSFLLITFYMKTAATTYNWQTSLLAAIEVHGILMYTQLNMYSSSAESRLLFALRSSLNNNIWTLSNDNTTFIFIYMILLVFLCVKLGIFDPMLKVCEDDNGSWYELQKFITKGLFNLWALVLLYDKQSSLAHLIQFLTKNLKCCRQIKYRNGSEIKN